MYYAATALGKRPNHPQKGRLGNIFYWNIRRVWSMAVQVAMHREGYGFRAMQPMAPKSSISRPLGCIARGKIDEGYLLNGKIQSGYSNDGHLTTRDSII